MHQTSHGTKNPFRMINKAHEVSKTGLASQINHSLEPRMMMPILAHLRELDSAPKMINNLLVSTRVPPFNGDVILPTGGDDPERDILPGQVVNQRAAGFFPRAEVDITFERGGSDAKAQPLIEELDETVKAMTRSSVATTNQRIGTLDKFHSDIVHWEN